MKPFVSLCMIVKNEEKVLSRCLDSVKNIIEEIIIVDTGSTDRTKEIALRYTNYIYDFDWTDSFADARNFAQSKANGEWILVLDADEYVDSSNLKASIQEIKELNDTTIEGFEVKIYNFTGFQGERIIQHRSIRIYKNDRKIRYQRTIHEQIGKTEGELKITSSPLTIYHSGYLNKVVKEKDKGSRNRKLLEKEIRLSGNKGFDYFNLGNEYQSLGNYEKALDAYINAYKNKPDIRYSWVSFCLVQMVSCLISLKRYNDALHVINDAENIYSQSPDFKFLKGNIFLLQHRYDDAINELENILTNKNSLEYCLTSIDFLEYLPHRFLGGLYKEKKNYSKSVYHYVKALTDNRLCTHSLYNLLQVLSKFHSDSDIYSFIEERGFIKSQREIVNVIQILLKLQLVSLANKYVEKLEDKTIQNGLRLKIAIYSSQFDEVNNFIEKGTLENFADILKNGLIDIYDLLIYGLLSNNNFIILLSELITKEDKTFIQFVFENNFSNVPKEDYYLNLLERCIQLEQFDLFEQLILKKNYYPKKINLKIGHLLFRYEFTELAFAFYQEVNNLQDYDTEAFIHIIQGFIEKNEFNDALQYAIFALNHEHNDYLIINYAIEAATKTGQDQIRKVLASIALQLFPDSGSMRKTLLSANR